MSHFSRPSVRAILVCVGSIHLLSGCQFQAQSKSTTVASALQDQTADVTKSIEEPESSKESKSPQPLDADQEKLNSPQIQPAPTNLDSSSNPKISKKQSLAESFLFHPLKYPEGFDRLVIEGQRVRFKSEDGTRLDGHYFLAPRSKGIIVFCHGNAGNLASRTQRMKSIQERFGYSVFVFDYRGYGRSEGKPTVSGVIADGRAAIRQAAELANVNPSEVIVMGRSLGGAVAAQLAKEFQSPKLILESTFLSFREVARHHASILAGFARKTDLNTLEAVKDYEGQLLISHGNEDRVVPMSHGKKLFEAASQPKLFYEVQNGGHNDPMPEGYNRILGEFLARQ